jgi:NlpC/P60 family putative phage cell wall peptidase
MRPDIVSLARAWLGTPYRHQASLKGVGCDCLGLVRGVYAEAYGRPAETPPPYSRDWAEAARRETMIEAAERHLIRIDVFSATAGDVVIFRLRTGAMAKHCGILSLSGAPGIRPAVAHLAVGPEEGGFLPGTLGIRPTLAHLAVGPEERSIQTKMIHAMEGAPVSEVHLSPWWQRRIAAAFRFPDQES